MSPQERANPGMIPGYLPELTAVRVRGPPGDAFRGGARPHFRMVPELVQAVRILTPDERSVGTQYLNPLLRIWTIGLS